MSEDFRKNYGLKNRRSNLKKNFSSKTNLAANILKTKYNILKNNDNSCKLIIIFIIIPVFPSHFKYVVYWSLAFFKYLQNNFVGEQ